MISGQMSGQMTRLVDRRGVRNRGKEKETVAHSLHQFCLCTQEFRRLTPLLQIVICTSNACYQLVDRRKEG